MSSNSPESQFTPRKEFIREQRPTPNSFSLLAISGSNCVRLYTFSPSTVAALRRLLDQRKLITVFREDVTQNLCEFALEGKPWASAKSVYTERLLIDMLAVFYQHGYRYLSTIDYGREHDDRLAMAFSKPIPWSSSRSDSPLPATFSPPPRGSLSEQAILKRIPFALSFPSATLLRVIAPPLHSTPAILQAVRGAWPRGVISEKKVGDNSFESKLKGYKWFQEDTFATDSLRHILALLSSLDAHGFSLLASISLTNRSRVKDLWIFTGPAPTSTDSLSLPESPVPSILNSPHPDMKRVQSPEALIPLTPVPSGQSQQSQTRHRKLMTDPSPAATSPQPSHLRSASESPRQMSPLATPSNVLRKAAPRAQIPVSVHEADIPEQAQLRANMPSVVPESAENLTGVGSGSYRTPDVFYATSPFGITESSGQPVKTSESASGTCRSQSGTPLDEDTLLIDGDAQKPLLTHSDSLSPPSSPDQPPPATPPERPHPLPVQAGSHAGSDPKFDLNGSHTPPLLSPAAFRDSTFSTSTEATLEIPIKWAGAVPASEGDDGTESVGPTLPGAWQPTPIEEKEEEGQISITLDQDKVPSSPVQDVTSRVASPELTSPDAEQRKSEAGLVGLIGPPDEAPSSLDEVLDRHQSESGGQGWVVVDVEGKEKKDDAKVDGDTESSSQPGGQPSDGPSSQSEASVSPPPAAPNAAKSPAVKAIAIKDAVDAKSKPASTTSSKVNLRKDPESPSVVKRFFSMSKRNSISLPQPDEAASHATAQVNASANEKPKRSLRDIILRTGQPVEPSRERRKSVVG